MKQRVRPAPLSEVTHSLQEFGKYNYAYVGMHQYPRVWVYLHMPWVYHHGRVEVAEKENGR